jgi:putative thioredoxin
VPLARILLARGEREQARQVLSRIPGSFAADGLVARIELEDSGQLDLNEAFTALDQGEQERALELLLGSLASADGARDDVRRVIVGILEDLGVEHPLARESRRKLAAALY